MALTLPLAVVDAVRGGVIHSGAGWSAVAAIAYLGIGTGVAYLLFAHVLSRIDASRFAVILYAVPTLGVVASWIVLGERPLGRDVAGGGVILLAVWISERARARE
jgi:drug/metabolite transporter (DMT)-like permease